MASEEHLKILERGVGVWNEWRQNHPSTTPNLNGLELRRTNLEKINLRGASLNNAILEESNLRFSDLGLASLEVTNFDRADLSGAKLQEAKLFAADLNGTLLINAELSWADFLNARMVGAVLVGAFCELTNFSHVDLSGADLQGANFNSTIFGHTNLTGATGLESCGHFGPSIIDQQTLAKSGMLPLNFLRGCGLPDTLINYLPSLISDPIQFNSCFISYSNEDQLFARRLHADLQDKGVRCWFAPENLKIGDKIR